jgi:DDE superfamily endonuclease
MTKRVACPPAPGPLEAYAAEFDGLFGTLAQRRGFREYLAGLLLPRDRNKTLTALVGAEPIVGAQAPAVQRLQFFLSESPWEAEALNARRLELAFAESATAPHEGGVLVIDDTGDRKDGSRTAHVARQYLGSLGKVDNGIVAVSSLWADERVYCPLHVRPYTPAGRLPRGQRDPAFRTKPQLAVELVDAALELGVLFRAVVADCFYGENEAFEGALWDAELPYVLGLKPSKGTWAREEEAHTPEEAARALRWSGPEAPGDWTPVVRGFRDGRRETRWAADLTFAGYGPDRPVRLVVVTTDPATLPVTSTWYLATNLPHPAAPAADSPVPAADLAEVVRVYGLRKWVEQGYKHVKHELGWADFMVRSDRAIRRHWALVCCAFSFCWRAWFGSPASAAAPPSEVLTPEHDRDSVAPAGAPAGRGENRPDRTGAGERLMAAGPPPGSRLAGAVDPPLALVARLVEFAPTAGAPSAPRLGRAWPPAQPLPPLLTNYR